jgi:hypothetical protein
MVSVDLYIDEWLAFSCQQSAISKLEAMHEQSGSARDSADC